MSLTAATGDIEIRHCSTIEQFDECVSIARATWGESVAVPSGIFVVAHHSGGQVLAAFEGARMVGFTLAFAGSRSGEAFLHSHMTAVLPDYQDRGIGRSLKLFQRQQGLKRGFRLVEWTFDPLELKNAHLSVARLGAVARRFIPNCYGITKSPLHAGLPTDRLVAEWWLESERVRAILAGSLLPRKEPVGRITLPSNITEIKSSDQAVAAEIQGSARSQFVRAFRDGSVATGIEPRGPRTDYILEPSAAIAGLQLPDTALN
jgi:predicted GNAT superfamily acetyltransferase